ncbi:hypothetical protein [Vibrio alginolyticus]|uniref:hypothetical protein n=1 Tax=Vibrio alginolyticus TaxID=663 RepID=UPI000A5A43CF
MTKPLHGASTPESTHTKNATRAESLLNCLLVPTYKPYGLRQNVEINGETIGLKH